jgi:U3 small nucleolar RNA-associated protein 21
MKDKTLTLVSLELDFENSALVTSGKVTNCGNFALIGFSNGQIIKFNMQSGKSRKRFRIKK